MEKDITGMQIYYYMVCKRKLWYYSNSIQMENDNENVVLGKLIDENSYVREEVFKICKKYLVQIQNSVFEGELSVPQLKTLKMELSKYVRDDSDSLIIFKNRQEKWLDKEFLGIQENLTDNFI